MGTINSLAISHRRKLIAALVFFENGRLYTIRGGGVPPNDIYDVTIGKCIVVAIIRWFWGKRQIDDKPGLILAIIKKRYQKP